MDEVDEKYGAILVDTSIFDNHALKLEKGLLGKLAQFKNSPPQKQQNPARAGFCLCTTYNNKR